MRSGAVPRTKIGEAVSSASPLLGATVTPRRPVMSDIAAQEEHYLFNTPAQRPASGTTRYARDLLCFKPCLALRGPTEVRLNGWGGHTQEKALRNIIPQYLFRNIDLGYHTLESEALHIDET